MLVRSWILPIFLLVISACVNIDISFGGNGDETPAVKFEDVRFEVEVANSPALRDKGLSGRSFMEERRGMLFIPDGPEIGPFWMRGMRFPLDLIWIGKNCRVVDITAFVPVPRPGTPDHELRRYHSYPPAAYTLEVNAGEAHRFNIRVGDSVDFQNIKGHC